MESNFRTALRAYRMEPQAPCVEVQLWIGSMTCARAVVDIFEGDTLLVHSIDDDSELARYGPGLWRSATVYDGQGWPLYVHVAKTSPREPLPDDELHELAATAADVRRV